MRVNVIDPESDSTPNIAELFERPDHVFAVSAIGSEMARATTPSRRFIGPGWVDLHAHVYHAFTPISVAPDQVGLDHGVHLVVDAGSAGHSTLPGLIDYVRTRSETDIRCWINIGSHGLVHLREISRADFIDVDATICAIEAARDVVCGVKVRSSGAIVGEMGIQPLQLARLVARESGLPLMVHIGEAPPVIEDVLDLLGSGDVITHCYHGKTGAPWRPDGRPVPALERAVERGVHRDVGHGAASFDSTVARRAIAAGFAPDSISTDIHVRNIAGPVHDLATVMTKILDCGMPLPDVIAAVTSRPRAMMGAPRPWLGEDGAIRHATVFEIRERAPQQRRYVDASGAEQSPSNHIVPVATIVNGVWRDCTAG
jgi:dihydroorotase